MKPGTRIVSNTFTMDDWEADETATVTEECTSWCSVLMWIVPEIEGTWTMPEGRLTLTQKYQMVSGTLGSQPITEARLRGDQITFTVGSTKDSGKVSVSSMEGTGGRGGAWKATRGGL